MPEKLFTCRNSCYTTFTGSFCGHVVLLELRRDSRVMTGNLGFLLLALKNKLVPIHSSFHPSFHPSIY